MTRHADNPEARVGSEEVGTSGQNDPPMGAREPTGRPREASGQAAAQITDSSREAAESGDQPYAVWSSERAFVLSTAAAGVGLGNLWRFPTLAGENGGGAFLLAYAIAVIVFAIPFAALEIAIGRHAHGSVIATFRRLGRIFVPIGIAIVLLTLVINS